jgi:hypothetical protein
MLCDVKKVTKNFKTTINNIKGLLLSSFPPLIIKLLNAKNSSSFL